MSAHWFLNTAICIITATFALAGPAKAQQPGLARSGGPVAVGDPLPECSEPMANDKPLPRNWPCVGASTPGPPPVLTLSCDGTRFYMGREGVGGKEWPVTKMALHVNLSERTITGFITDARISKISDEASIEFEEVSTERYFLRGSIDRITGSVFASYVIKSIGIEANLKLLCKPLL
jgi:hypothetical protein